jgi:hypothetical protein
MIFGILIRMQNIMRMINKKVFLCATLFLIATVIILLSIKQRQEYHIKLFKSEHGWGYDISIGKNLFIHQPYMPAVSGQVAFINRKSARETALLVVKKLKNKQSPGISSGELRSIVRL